jgi:hypothetical protein
MEKESSPEKQPKLSPEYVYSDKLGWPKTIEFENQVFEFRHENPDLGNAVYVRRMKLDSPVQVDNLAVDIHGNVLLHQIYDEAESENYKASLKPKG